MFLSRELSNAGGTKGSTTMETRHDVATKRDVRLSVGGRWAEKWRTELRRPWTAAATAMLTGIESWRLELEYVSLWSNEGFTAVNKIDRMNGDQAPS